MSATQEDDKAAKDVEEAMEILHGMQDDDKKMYDELEEQLEKKEKMERTGKPPRRSAAIAADKALDGSKSAPLTVSGVRRSVPLLIVLLLIIASRMFHHIR